MSAKRESVDAMTYDEDDWDDDESTSVIPCSNCGAEVYEEADCCPSCGEFLIDGSRPLDQKPAWFVVLGLLGIVAVVLLLSGVLQWF